MARRGPVALVAVFSAVAAAALVLEHQVGAAKPLSEQVLIRRDTFGIPHIYGETDEAAAFGLGYAQAEDHLEPLARRLVQSRGGSAKIFGEPAIESDFAMRRLGNLPDARRHLGDLGKAYRKVIRAFALGVNRYVEQHRGEAPPWVPAFDEADVLASTRAGAVEAVGSAGLVRRLRDKYPGGDVPGAPPARAGNSGDAARPAADDDRVDEPGSNALAIGPSRSASGHPILLANPHLRWSSLYWEAHLVVPRRLNFYGSALVGMPWLRAGFNDRLGYAQTNNAPDLEDVYALRRDPRDATRYLFDRRSRPIVQTDVAVEVKGADGTLRTERRTYWSTHLGPVVYRTNEMVFAY